MSGLKGRIQLGRAGWELFPSEHCEGKQGEGGPVDRERSEDDRSSG